MNPVLVYWGVLVGTFLEGEVTILSAAVAAHMGHLKLPWIIGIAIIGVQLTDWLRFLAGRYLGKTFVESRPKLGQKLKKVNHWISQHPIKILLVYRFIYGFRTVFPIAIGLSNISIYRFATFSLISAIVWACLYGALGYFFGNILVSEFEYLKSHSWEIFLGLALLAGLIGLIRLIILRRRLHRLRNRHTISS